MAYKSLHAAVGSPPLLVYPGCRCEGLEDDLECLMGTRGRWQRDAGPSLCRSDNAALLAPVVNLRLLAGLLHAVVGPPRVLVQPGCRCDGLKDGLGRLSGTAGPSHLQSQRCLQNVTP